MILVTGATGLVGSHLIYSLLQAHDTVVALCRPTSDKALVKKVLRYYADDVDTIFNRIQWREADLLDVYALQDVFDGITHVYHCAAIVSFNPAEADRTILENTQSTANLVNVCLHHKITKFIHVSSVAALGRAGKKSLISENTQWTPSKHNSAYAKSKYKSELEVWRGQQEGLDMAIVNPGIILGPGDWSQGSPALVKKIADGFKYYTLGTNGYVDVRDVVAIMIQLMTSDIKNDRFILVAENLSYKKIFDLMAEALGVKAPYAKAEAWQAALVWRAEWLRTKIFGGKPLITSETARSAQATYFYENNKVRKALDFTFVPIAETIEHICACYKADNFKGLKN
jgi:dihydroflavonol-4-reductase